MSFWRTLFFQKAEKEKSEALARALADAVAANKVAREKVGDELANVIRGLADDLSHATDSLGGGRDRK